ncbi:unnamed protein product [Arctia plantaginis]|uniref:Uncharacterized protein n=1 Tax=Arctia plantaginis TaxID=874455 RepID=A0A8S1ARB1_ARCPL|nr:unnamed protein product [Arctia plantaginis]CAB3260450.1 unnamed protein product [Arctia plantaginis]
MRWFNTVSMFGNHITDTAAEQSGRRTLHDRGTHQTGCARACDRAGSADEPPYSAGLPRPRTTLTHPLLWQSETPGSGRPPIY